MPEINTDITAQLDALSAAWKDSNRKMDNAAHRGDITAYMNERKANVRSIRAMRDSLIAKHREDAATIAALREVVDGFEGLLDIPHVVHRASGHESVYARHKTRLDAARARLANLKGDAR